MEAPLFIREHARNIRHFVADLFTQYSGWPGAADSSANEFICAEIAAAITRHEADMWTKVNRGIPDPGEIVCISFSYHLRGKQFKGFGYIDIASGTWKVYDIIKTKFVELASPLEVIAWRRQPEYKPLED